MKKWIIFLLAIPLVLASCTNSYCPPEAAEAALAEIEDLAEEWDDAVAVAFSSSRMALSGPISDLQDIKRDVGNLEVPECLVKSRDDLEKGMVAAIDGFIAFLGQESDTTVSTKFDLYDFYLDKTARDIDEIRDCLPNCKAP